ncbi:MAG: DUF1015 domain-containing protein [Eubacteriales bacterium]|nr:DUF1015 domain-containing protein [Eubacteriales bacterium]
MKRAFYPADILLPKKELSQSKWSVVACDQFTSEPEYWENVENIVSDEPSTYRMILPEVYLEEEDVESRIAAIQQVMIDYEEKGYFETYKDAMIYVEREDSEGKMRAGLVACFDLEAYDYHKGSSSLIRATEATVIERIPPRVKVRKDAIVELPHIMILVDDPEQSVIEPIGQKKDKMEQVYDYDMMLGGGHNRGYLLDKEQQEKVLSALDLLGSQEHFDKKYDIHDMPVLLYAMGDGNHSLATAKECYEQLKAAYPDQDMSKHPARYALAELVNLHSPALEFEAIHRIVTEIDSEDIKEKMTEELVLCEEELANAQSFEIMENGVTKTMWIGKPSSKLTVGSVQNFLDAYLKEQGGKIDYIHGIDVMKNLTKQENSIGFLLPDMDKSELFPTVIFDGALPRKTFSMGHAQDKRYYMECRKIK